MAEQLQRPCAGPGRPVEIAPQVVDEIHGSPPSLETGPPHVPRQVTAGQASASANLDRDLDFCLNPCVRILYRDDLALAVDKPAGLLTVPGRGGAKEEEALSGRVRAIAPGAMPVHRLDRDTSGIVLFALTREAHRALNQAFEAHRPEKTYLALVRGDLASPARCDLPLADARRGGTRIAGPRAARAHRLRTRRALRRADALQLQALDRTHAPDPRASRRPGAPVAGRSALRRRPSGAARRALRRRRGPWNRRAVAHSAARIGAAHSASLGARLAADRSAASRRSVGLPRAAARRAPAQPFPCTSVFTSALKATEILSPRTSCTRPMPNRGWSTTSSA